MAAARRGLALLGINLIASGGAGAYSGDRQASLPGALLRVKFAARLHVKAGRHFNVARLDSLTSPQFSRPSGVTVIHFFLTSSCAAFSSATAVVGLGPIFRESACNGAAADSF